ncbi:MAG TPA: phosphotransferase [Mycobacteriales bacterium]|jgi:aminoglycoside phosphotransferase (APT) family kinase protein|nr:phosphotransferase [Mycobacteriales bacterium]
MTDLLDVDTGLEYARHRGILAAGGRCVELGGGISNVVLLVEDGSRRAVVKQSLGRLRVAELWEAPVDRIVTEARALGFAAAAVPGAVPAVLDSDPAAHTMTVQAAPAHWTSWKDQLLQGIADPGVAAGLGSALGALHNAPTDTAPWLDQPAAFRALRVDPYHYAVAERLPSVAAPVLALAAEMENRHRCFVHGDYSPKNVLVGDGAFWIIDFEVAHLGDPAFDLAFLLNHLLLKAVYRPQDHDSYRRCATAFLDAYALTGAPAAVDRHLAAHLGCLMVARTVGKSPAEYLDRSHRDTVTEIATRALLDGPDTVNWFWDAVAEKGR